MKNVSGLLSFLALSTVAATLGAAPRVAPDEGMWTFDNPPLERLREDHDFTPTPKWLEHVRLSSVRLNDGGSGSFISPNGLVLTNHHVGFSAIQKLSSEERDLINDGFYAASAEEELTCTDLEINVLESMLNVTDKVQGAVAGGASDQEAREQREAEIARIEQGETDASGLRCDVIELYEGGQYVLYRYKKYTDVKLVFAPDQQSAFFGGDPDNFNFPRFCLDMAIFRVYEDGKPASTPHYLEWNEEGSQAGDLVFVSGNPGSTGRMNTLAQLEYLRDVAYPRALRSLERRKAVLAEYSARGSEQARQAKRQLFGIENALKAVGGYHQSLAEGPSMDRKRAAEGELREFVENDAIFNETIGGAWDRIAEAQRVASDIGSRAYFSSVRGSRLFSIARHIVRMSVELEKPNEERLPEYRDSALESLELSLFSEAPVYPEFEEVMMRAGLAEIEAELGAEDPLVVAAHAAFAMPAGASPAGPWTRLGEPAFRRALVEGGAEAVAATNDRIVKLAAALDPIARELRTRMEDEVESVETQNGKLIARALFGMYGSSMYPDATFTLRLSYGTVVGFESAGYPVSYKTTFNGLYERAASYDNQAPWNLPAVWSEQRAELDLATPYNFVCTADIIGGNSGSPVIDRDGKLVGLIFDGNIFSLGNRFVFDDTIARSVAVHSAGMLEAMRKIYGADALVEEILAGSGS